MSDQRFIRLNGQLVQACEKKCLLLSLHIVPQGYGSAVTVAQPDELASSISMRSLIHLQLYKDQI